MTANKERLLWMSNPEWYRANYEEDCFELTEEAPEEARRSFELWNSDN